MKNDRICWIDSRTIKRGRVLVLDRSLVPFCSKCLVTCMRVNYVLKSLKIGSKLVLTVEGRTVRHTCKMSRDMFSSLVRKVLKGGRSGPVGRTVRRFK